MRNETNNYEMILTTGVQLPLPADKTYKAIIKRVNNLHPAGVTLPMVIDYLAQVKAEKSSSTFNNYLAGLKKSLLMVAERSGKDSLIFKLKFENTLNESGLKRIKIEQAVREDDVLTALDIENILKAANPRTKLIITALTQTAARVSELLSIRIVNCVGRGEFVNVKIVGKGSRERTVFLTRETFNAIKKEFKGTQFLFESRNHKPLNDRNVRKAIYRVGELVGIDNLHPHLFRHSFATLQIKAGKGIEIVSEYLGHKSIMTTQAFYNHGRPCAEQIFKDGKTW